MTHKKMQKSKSLCEKSMDLVVNIIKLSSLSLVAINMGEKHDTNRPFISTPIDPFSSSARTRGYKAQASKSKMQTYLMEEDAGVTSHSLSTMIYGDHIDDATFSDYINRFHKRIQNEVNVNTDVTNGKTSPYVKRFHQKNSHDNNLAASAGFPLVTPPPLPSLKKRRPCVKLMV